MKGTNAFFVRLFKSAFINMATAFALGALIVGPVFVALVIINEAVLKRRYPIVNFFHEGLFWVLILTIFILESRAGFRSFKILGNKAWAGGVAALFFLPLILLVFGLLNDNNLRFYIFSNPSETTMALFGFGLFLSIPQFIGAILATFNYKRSLKSEV